MSSSTSSNRAFGGKPWFRSLAESIPALVWASGSDGLCTYFNSIWLQFTGRTFEESLGNGWLADVHPSDSDRVMNEYNHAFQGRRRFRLEYRLRDKSGRYKWIVDFGSPVFSTDGNFQGYIGSCAHAVDPHIGKPETHWREHYESAVESSDRGNLAERIARAEISIRNRLEQVSDPEEASVLRTCLATIAALKNDELGFVGFND